MNRLLRLPARPVSEVLGDLQALGERHRGGEPLEPPGVTLWLKGGDRIAGVLVHYDRRQELVLVLDQQTGEATYLPLAEIRGLTVQVRDDLLESLSGGLLKPHAGAPPSRLELKRQARDLAELLGVPFECALEDGDEAAHALARGLRDLEGVLKNVRGDTEGRESFARAVRSVTLGSRSSGFGVELRDGCLQIWHGIEAGTLRLPAREELKAAIERLL